MSATNFVIPNDIETIFSFLKEEAFENIAKCRLMEECGKGNGFFIQWYLGGAWPFVKDFPKTLEKVYTETHEGVPEKEREFLAKNAQKFSGNLETVIKDEEDHRRLWVLSAKAIGLSEDDLDRWEKIPEVLRITPSILNFGLIRKFARIVCVEWAAEGIAVCLLKEDLFKKKMGQKGLGWYVEHTKHDGTPHEKIALRLLVQTGTALGVDITPELLTEEIRKGMDLFINGLNAIYAHACEEREQNEALA